MKIIAFLFAVCIVSTSAQLISKERQAKLTEYRAACTVETGVSSAVIDNAKVLVFPARDEKLDCFALCFLKKIGFIKADGTFDEAALRAKIPKGFPPAEAEKIIAKCIPLSGANDCETAGKRFRCFLETKTVRILN